MTSSAPATATGAAHAAAPGGQPGGRLRAELDRQIEQVVLPRQDPITGLLPASTAHTVHGNYGDAWVRDCVYSIQCVWGLALAHRRLSGATTRGLELEQRVLQLMRGLLNAMLRQAHKVERFKHSLDPLDALHAKFDTASGEPVVPDDGWGHLQLDATALFLLQLAQLTRSGLVVVQTSHERDFLQNLVYYVARAYRVADYGIWERGDKGNHGLPERNASSIGLVKAALEALEGLDLYGPHGDGSAACTFPTTPSCACAAPSGPAAARIGQQGGGCRLPVGDRLPRLGRGGSRPGGAHPQQDPHASWAAPTATSASAATATRPWWKTTTGCTTNGKSWPSSSTSNASGRCFWPTNWSRPAAKSAGVRPGSGASGCGRVSGAGRTGCSCCPSSTWCRKTRWRPSAATPAARRASPTTTCRCSGPRASPGWVI